MQSLKRLELTKAASASAVPFEKIMTIEERPLMIVVPWPNDTATQDDIYLVKDLSTHLAAAFFEKVAGQMPTGNGGGS